MTGNISNSLLGSNLAEADHSSHRKSAMTRRGLIKRGAALSVAGQTSLLGLGMLNPGLAHANSISYKSYGNIFSGTVKVAGIDIDVSLRKYTNQENRADFWAVTRPSSSALVASNRRAVKYIDQGLQDYQFCNSFVVSGLTATFNPVAVEKNFTLDAGVSRRAQEINWNLPTDAYGKVYYTVTSSTETIVNMVSYFSIINGKAVQQLKYTFNHFDVGNGWIQFAIKKIVGNNAEGKNAIVDIIKAADLATNKLNYSRTTFGTVLATVALGVGGLIAGAVAEAVLDEYSTAPWVLAMGAATLFASGVSVTVDRLKAAGEASLAVKDLLTQCRAHYS